MNYDRINVMLPTRKRVANGRLPRLLRSLEEKTSDPRAVCVTLLVDEDDRETRQYIEHDRKEALDIATHVLYNRDKSGPHLARFFNYIYAHTMYNDPGTLVSMMGDDMEVATQGWEQLVLRVANETQGLCVVYGDDDYIQHERMPVYFFTSRRVVRMTGMAFMWEMWRANLIDYVWGRIAKELGILRYLPELHITHHHSSVDGPDATYHGMDAYRVFATGREALIEAYVAQAVKNARGCK